MSDLRDLAQSVQHAIDVPPFEKLARRATWRRRRKTAFAAAGVVGIAATIVSLIILPGGAPQPAASPEAEGRALVQGAGAQLETTLMTSPTDWAASWADCTAEPCRYGAVLSRNGQTSYLPVKLQPYVILQVGNEPVAAFGPDPESPESDWPEPSLARLTDRGVVQTRLRFVAPSATFTAAEVLTDKFGVKGLEVINLEDSTLRSLVPASGSGIGFPSAPVRDSTGRWWALTTADNRVIWTDDGTTWQGERLDAANAPGKLAVSPNGRTIAATSLNPFSGNTFVSIATLTVSTNAGRTWRTVGKPDGHSAGPITLDDGSVLLLGQQPDDPDRGLYAVTGRQVRRLNDAPDLTDFTGDDKLLYGLTIEPMTAQVAFSTDHGKTWSNFEPR